MPTTKKSESPVKRKRGRPRKHPLPDPDAPKRPRGRPRKEEAELPEIATPPESAGRASILWAEAVQFAVENQARVRMSKKRAGSALKHAMWEIGREFPKELAFQLMPKAMAIMDKHDNAKSDDEIISAEEKAVGEIDELIKAAIAESKSC